MAIWAMPRACKNADFTWSGQLGGSGTEDKFGSIQTVIAQADPRRKGPLCPQKLPANYATPPLGCGKILPDLVPMTAFEIAGPGHHAKRPVEQLIQRVCKARGKYSAQGRRIR